MRYFPSRVAAGDLIADQLEAEYRYEDTAVLALSDGGVIVGSSIAKRLHCSINLLLVSGIRLPQELEDVATINNFGGVTYTDTMSAGELEEMKAEYFNYIEQQKLQKLFEMNEIVGANGVLNPRMLMNRHIVIVSDGLVNGFSMQAASDFIKPYKVKSLIMVTPFATVSAVDQMHVLADKIICLNVLEDIISVDHYYDDSTVPPHALIIKTLQDIVLQWQ